MLHLRNRTEVMKDFFFIEMRDDFTRVSDSVVVDTTQQSTFANQVDQNIYLLNPYIILKAATNTTVALGYMYQHTHYSAGPLFNKIDNIGYAATNTNLSTRMTLSTGVRFTQDQNSIENYHELDVYAGLQYTYAQRSFIFTNISRSRFDFAQHPDLNPWYWLWDAGINHQVSLMTYILGTRRIEAQDTTRVLTLEDQYYATIRRDTLTTGLTIGVISSEYRDPVLDQLIATGMDFQGAFLYRFTPRTSGTLGVEYQEVDSKSAPIGVTKIVLSAARIDHLLTAKSTLSFEYRFLNAESADIPINNYINNRYLVEFRQAF
jgi:hypothetical protein